jgi:D-alanyl-D-alanine carboxypeptidase
MSELLDYGFDNFKVNRIVYDGMALSQFVVNGGESYVVGEAKVDIDSVVPKSAQMNNLQMNYKIVDGGLRAPIQEDQLIATLEIQYRNSVMTEVEVFAVSSVKAMDNTGVTIRSTAVRSDSDDSGILSVIGTISVIILGLAVAYLAFNAYMRSKMRARRRKRRAARRRNR